MNKIYINIGTEKSCLFCYLSKHLIKILSRYPLLHFCIEESLECVKNGYYGIAILVFAQILNQFNIKTPSDRHAIAHEILKTRPNKKMYDKILNQFKRSAKLKYEQELQKAKDINEYHQNLNSEWKKLYR